MLAWFELIHIETLDSTEIKSIQCDINFSIVIPNIKKSGLWDRFIVMAGLPLRRHLAYGIDVVSHHDYPSKQCAVSHLAKFSSSHDPLNCLFFNIGQMIEMTTIVWAEAAEKDVILY